MRAVFTLSLLLASAPALAQSSEEYARMAKRAWQVFECAALANTADMPAGNKHFDDGYSLAKAYITALRAGKVEAKHVSSIVPMGVSWSMWGPSTDFMLGVIWSSAEENALKGVFEDEITSEPINASLWKRLAETKYNRANCSLL